MERFLTPLTYQPFIEWPGSLAEWTGLVLLLALLAWGILRQGRLLVPSGRADRNLFFILAACSVVFVLVAGSRLPAEDTLPRTLLPEEPRGPAFMVFGNLPWMLAAGFLSPAAAVVIGILGGAARAAFDTHNLFTVIQTGGMAYLFSLMIRQNYRTLGYRLLRRPFISAASVGIIAIPFILITTSLHNSGPAAARVDYTLVRLPSEALAAGIELFAAGILAEAASWIYRARWGNSSRLIPSPSETSLQIRFFLGMGPLVILLLGALMVGDWYLAGRAARQMVEEQMMITARTAAQTIPYFLEAGQNQILDLASEYGLVDDLQTVTADDLAKDVRSIPYFRQVFIYDNQGVLLRGYPEAYLKDLSLTGEEQSGIALAQNGVSVQSYAGGAVKGEKSALISFISPITNNGGKVAGVILGRTDLASNPYTKPVIQTFDRLETSNILGVSSEGTTGTILDENGKILYHPTAGRVLTSFGDLLGSEGVVYEATKPDGTRSLVYSEAVPNGSWSVVISVPNRRVQQLALRIAVPLLLMIVFIAIAAVVLLRLGLRGITTSLQMLEAEAGRISQGQLDHTLQVKSVDEVGRLGQAFERMRQGLKAQLGELNRLLDVSQGVAGNLNMGAAVQPILEAALANGAVSARVVLNGGFEPADRTVMHESYGCGESTDRYSYLDDQILNMVQTHDPIVMPNLTRGKGLNLRTSARPRAVIGMSLRHETEVLGALWLGYETPHTFSEEEVRFLSTLAGEAAMAAANTRLYTRAEIGRQRVEAILDSTPDPVFVTDSQNRLILVNPAARLLPGMAGVDAMGQPVEAVVLKPEIAEILKSPVDMQHPREYSFEDGRVYYASVSRLSIGDQPVGKVCILRDITHFKQMDTIKSDFVTTVSHDLRTPLSLLSGYATMIQMVGELNEQQKTYIRRITNGVESMNHMVNNLLDLGRIDTGMGLQLEKIPVNNLLDRVVNSLQLQAAQKNIQIGRDYTEDDNPVVCVDQALLHQALYNLLENAIKFTPVGGQVNLHAAMQRDGVVLSITDSGIGIAPLDQPRLFEKFYRGGQREAFQQRGSGLGLAIVKSIAERHHGKVWVESSLGKGSTFHLQVPYHPNGAGD